MKINRLDHVGIVVQDLDAAKAFFIDLGLKVEGEMDIEGEWVEKIIGLKNVKDKIVMMRTSDGEAFVELIQFYSPVDRKGIQPSFSNTLGMRHICFAVEDLDGVVSKLNKKGFKLVGEIQKYDNIYKLCYVRGPEGIILELAEKLNKDIID
jgi:catechol 2,3-dioxygenase-like lactoylglutathione lyase family enzyme